MLYAINGSETKKIVAEENSNSESGFIFFLYYRIRRNHNYIEEETTSSRWLADKWCDNFSLVKNYSPEAKKLFGEETKFPD